VAKLATPSLWAHWWRASMTGNANIKSLQKKATRTWSFSRPHKQTKVFFWQMGFPGGKQSTQLIMHHGRHHADTSTRRGRQNARPALRYAALEEHRHLFRRRACFMIIEAAPSGE
jgi:hypothetical protein